MHACMYTGTHVANGVLEPYHAKIHFWRHFLMFSVLFFIYEINTAEIIQNNDNRQIPIATCVLTYVIVSQTQLTGFI